MQFEKMPLNFLISVVEKSQAILLPQVKGQIGNQMKKFFQDMVEKTQTILLFQLERHGRAAIRKGGTAMAETQKKPDGGAEEIRDILIAISIVAKRLATKLEDKIQQMQEEQNGKEKRTVNNP